MGLTAFQDIRTKIQNKKQKARCSITYTTNQDFRKFLKNFNNSLYLGYKNKWVHNEPTKAYLFLIKQINQLVKSKKHVFLLTKGNKLYVKKTIEHVNGKSQSIITSMNRKKLKNINIVIMWNKEAK